MEPITGVIRNYAWGSSVALAELRGEEPSGLPEAELWFGAHEQASSMISRAGELLSDRIRSDPLGQLGADVVDRFGERLPYLLKILAADEPLSIQTHPTAAQAREGYAREEASGLDSTAPNRSYKDPDHKPELIVALTEFEALMGFRPPTESARFLRSLDVDGVAALIDRLDRSELASALRWVLTEARPEHVDDVVAACADRTDPHAGMLRRLAAVHPGDAGVLTAALLNRVVLQPGEGLYLDAGTLHAYVGGLGVEVMANSDNVLRGGLTPKHVDVEELLRVTTAEPLEPEVLAPAGSMTTYAVPAPEFELTRLIEPTDQARRPNGPEIVLAASGTATVTSNVGEAHRLDAGHALWIPATTEDYSISGTDLVFIVGVAALHSGEG